MIWPLKLAVRRQVRRVQRVRAAGVTRGDGKDDARVHGGLHRGQKIGARGTAAEAQIDDPGAVGDREVNAVGDVGVVEGTKRQARADAVGADRQDLRVEGDAVGADAVALGGRHTGDLGAVTVDIVEERGIAGDDIGRGGGDIGVEVGMIHVDPGIDHRDGLAGAGKAAVVGAQDVDIAEPEVGLELDGIEIRRRRRAATPSAAPAAGAERQRQQESGPSHRSPRLRVRNCSRIDPWAVHS